MGVQFAHSATVCPIKLPNRVLYFITQFPLHVFLKIHVLHVVLVNIYRVLMSNV